MDEPQLRADFAYLDGNGKSLFLSRYKMKSTTYTHSFDSWIGDAKVDSKEFIDAILPL